MKIYVVKSIKTNVSKTCHTSNCFEWRFNIVKEEGVTKLCCRRCGKERKLNDGEVLDTFPRKGNELIDEVNLVKRYSFIYEDGVISRVPMRVGPWVEHDAVLEIIEKYQKELNQLKGVKFE